ncbi:9069_t:CDS:2, partial [Scutellospora calospora]
VVIAEDEDLKPSKALLEQLEKAIRKVKESPETIEEHQEVKKYLQEIDKQLEYFKEFDEKVFDFNHMINLAFDILSSLANLKTEVFSLIEKSNRINLESNCLSEINLLVGEIDKYFKYLREWKNISTIITNQFKKLYEDLRNLNNNTKDSLFFFEIQEKLITEKEELMKKINQENEANLLHIIGLKLVYDLATELEYTTSRFKLLDLTSIQKISDFLEKLTYELQLSEEFVKNFGESELYVKECCLNYVVEKLSKI